MRDLYIRYSRLDPTHLLFAAPLGNISETYYNVDESVTILQALLRYQFDNDEEIIQAFLEDVYDIIDKRRPKKNTLFVLAPANSGKNFFFDCVVHFFLNFGLIGNFTKHCAFPLQNAVAKRILMWNEPQIEPGSFETIKPLLGGDQMLVRVKFQSDQTVGRTPIIVLANNDVFPKDLSYRTRMIRYEWRTYPKLVEYKKKPFPISIYHLFILYNILEV